jgi:hypothetical protein
MCTVSFAKEALNIAVHNQYPGLELTSPVYFSDGTTYFVAPNQQTDTGDIMETCFGIDSRRKDFKCVLLYKLQKKHAIRTDNQPDDSTISIENIATNMYLLVAWVIEDYKRRFCAYLVEFTDDFIWDDDKLWALYEEYNDQFYMDYGTRTFTWLMYDNVVMEMILDVTYSSDYRLDIIIFKGARKDDMKLPIKIDPKRLVLLLLSMLIVLMYTVSLAIRQSFKLDIHNQCLNVDLVSPTYTTDDELECYRPPNYKVCVGDIMRSGFIIKWKRKSYGALIYRLQKEQSHESTEASEDASNAVHLLVVWEIDEFEKLCADALLVECDKRFDWEKDNLKELYLKNSDLFRLLPDSAKATWLLDDNVALMTKFEIMNRDHILNITISEVERDNCARMPVHIDLKR